MTKALTEQEIIRRDSLKQLRGLGVDPYPAAMFEINTTSKEIKKTYKEGDVLEVMLQMI